MSVQVLLLFTEAEQMKKLNERPLSPHAEDPPFQRSDGTLGRRQRWVEAGRRRAARYHLSHPPCRGVRILLVARPPFTRIATAEDRRIHLGNDRLARRRRPMSAIDRATAYASCPSPDRSSSGQPLRKIRTLQSFQSFWNQATPHDHASRSDRFCWTTPAACVAESLR